MIRVSIDVLIWANIIGILVIMLLSFYLIFKRRGDLARRDKRDQYILQKTPGWHQYLVNNKPIVAELIPKNDHEHEGVEHILLSYQKNVQSPGIQERVKEFSNQHLRDFYRKRLSSNKWSTRMNTLRRISSFQLVSLLPECRKLAERKLSLEETYELAYILARFDPATFLRKFPDWAAQFSEYDYKKLLMAVNEDTFHALTLMAPSLPHRFHYSLADVMGALKDPRHVPFLENSMQSREPEVRIRSLKALSEIGVVDNLDKYLPLVDSPIWEERLMTARLLSQFPLSRTRAYLEKLSHDSYWWVRNQAMIGLQGGERKGPTLIRRGQESGAARPLTPVIKPTRKLTMKRSKKAGKK